MAESPWPAAYAHCSYDCCRCHSSIPVGEHVMLATDVYLDRCEPAHRRCVFATPAELEQIRAEACQQGHHRYPGQWRRDPDDPYGDARLWECARGCGYVRRHPGYGINRAIAAAEGALLPEVSRA